MITECPHCKSKFQAPEKATGTTAKCPKCAQPFKIVECIVVQPAVPARKPIIVNEAKHVNANVQKPIWKRSQAWKCLILLIVIGLLVFWVWRTIDGLSRLEARAKAHVLESQRDEENKKRELQQFQPGMQIFLADLSCFAEQIGNVPDVNTIRSSRAYKEYYYKIRYEAEKPKTIPGCNEAQELIASVREVIKQHAEVTGDLEQLASIEYLPETVQNAPINSIIKNTDETMRVTVNLAFGIAKFQGDSFLREYNGLVEKYGLNSLGCNSVPVTAAELLQRMKPFLDISRNLSKCTNEAALVNGTYEKVILSIRTEFDKLGCLTGDKKVISMLGQAENAVMLLEESNWHLKRWTEHGEPDGVEWCVLRLKQATNSIGKFADETQNVSLELRPR